MRSPDMQRTKGWQTGYWTNSNRVPWDLGVSDRWYHILDASRTCLLMLRWHDEIETDSELARVLPLVFPGGLVRGVVDETVVFPTPIGIEIRRIA